MNDVTRVRIADILGDAFGPQGAGKDDLLATATRAGAPPELLDELQKLPDRKFRTMRDLWDHLPEIPIE